MVRLHMVHNEIVQISPVQNRRQVFEKLPGHRAVHGVDQDGFLVQDHIGIVCDPPRDGIDILEQLDSPVAHTDIDDVIRHHTAAADPGELFLSFKGDAALFFLLGKGCDTAQGARRHKACGAGCCRFKEISSCDFFAHLFLLFQIIFVYLFLQYT